VSIINIINNIAYRKLKDEIKVQNHKPFICPLNDAKNIGIIFNATELSNIETIKKIYYKLKNEKNKIEILGFLNNNTIVTNDKINFINIKNINWYKKPKKIFIENFINSEFDILLNLDLDNLITLQFVSVFSKAKFKIGCYDKINSKIFDFMISFNSIENREEYNIENLVNLINFYSNNFKTK
jgi:hypothetical protein